MHLMPWEHMDARNGQVRHDAIRDISLPLRDIKIRNGSFKHLGRHRNGSGQFIVTN